MSNYSDHRLLNFLRRAISKKSPEINSKFRSIKCCGSRILQDASGRTPGVFILQNEQAQTSKIWGQTSCNNSWGCPVCSAKIMNHHAARITAAIDALHEQHQTAFMMTLTIPHRKNKVFEVTAADQFEIIYRAWRKFTAKCFHLTDKRNRDPLYMFTTTLNAWHKIRAAEATWGPFNGWHIHFHCLIWVDDNKFDQVAGWEYDLRKSWEKVVLRTYNQYFAEIYPNRVIEFDGKQFTNDDLINYIWGNRNRNKSTKSEMLYFSKNKDGTIMKAQSSDYICGWGADREATGNRQRKASAENHLTPYQILEKACNEKNPFYENLFFEFLAATRTYKARRQRIDYSRKGLKQIIDNWMKTQKYHEFLKKKHEHAGNWRILCWFSKQQWFTICHSEYVLENILFAAAHLDYFHAWDFIYQYLILYDINIDQQPYNFYSDFVEKMFNAA